MPSLKSKTAGGTDWAKDVAASVFPSFAESYPLKFYWFLQHGYRPHEWQASFHTASNADKLCRYRHLVAGRRGGKTLSAAWEVLFYCLHPEVFDQDGLRPDSKMGQPLWGWGLSKDHEVGRASRVTLLECCDRAGLIKDKDYKYNRSEKIFEFKNGSVFHFRTADDPQSLRGAGLDLMWLDEAAHIPTEEAYEVARPALSDKNGLIITTTTPLGKNWLWKEFWSEKSLADPSQFRVEYTSIDNPYFPKEEWDWALEHYHPVMFKQEYMASFDAMEGVELQGGWLHYYTVGTPGPEEIVLPIAKDGRVPVRKYMAVDPAVSLSDRADHFAMALIGVTEDHTQAFLMDIYKERIPFPDQVSKIKEWFLKHRPEYIGIESNAYQRALAQQASRLEGMPPIVPIISRGKKSERILSMAPAFKIGKIRIHKAHRDFIDEWVSYDSTQRNPEDDLLDAVEIALNAAGVLLPTYTPFSESSGPKSIHEEAWEQIKSRKTENYDSELGEMA